MASIDEFSAAIAAAADSVEAVTVAIRAAKETGEELSGQVAGLGMMTKANETNAVAQRLETEAAALATQLKNLLDEIRQQAEALPGPGLQGTPSAGAGSGDGSSARPGTASKRATNVGGYLDEMPPMVPRSRRSRGARPGKTQGRWIRGSDEHRDWISGGDNEDEHFRAAETHWAAIRSEGEPEKLSITRDTEVKFAMFMRKHGMDHEELVINNPDGPCGYGRDGFAFGCDQLLPRFLRPGATLTVHWPGGAKTYQGATELE